LYLTGGLGNQLFQLKFAQELNSRGLEIALDTSALAPRSFELPEELMEFSLIKERKSQPRIFHLLAHKNLLPNVIFDDNPRTFHKLLSNLISLNHFGYYQSIRGDITFPIQLGNFEELLLAKYDFAERLSHSLAIHIRGGDFKGNKTYSTLGVDYYVDILRRINFGNMRDIFVFTDDPDYADILINSINLRFDLSGFKIIFISQELSPFETLKLLSTAECRIISNSTFSWWGGVLALSRGRSETYAPKTFFRKKKMIIPLPEVWKIQSV
jgi:hypothetical protein